MRTYEIDRILFAANGSVLRNLTSASGRDFEILSQTLVVCLAKPKASTWAINTE